MTENPDLLQAFAGSFGEDWCVRAGELGTPDRASDETLHWLIVPGPPLACYLVHFLPTPDPTAHTYYHMHPSTWSIHIVAAGRARYFVEGKEHVLMPGMAVYHGPKVRHSVVQYPNEPCTMYVVQHPGLGYGEGEWQVCPEAGTTDRFGSIEAFVERFGDPTGRNLAERIRPKGVQTSKRWDAFVGKSALDKTTGRT